MRCLTLADALKANQGADTLFLCREHTGHLADLVRQRGHRIILLPVEDGSVEGASLSHDKEPAHASWLGTDWETDAKRVLNVLAQETMVDWLVVDHYALDIRWEQSVRLCCRRLMVIDDLADRAHDCDLLLDQNLGREENDYAALVPVDCTKLLGTRYALLRLEFERWRIDGLERRKSPRLQHLLISMGGVDKDNATGLVLSVLRPENLPEGCDITVVMGSHAPYLTEIRESSKKMFCPTEVLVNVQNMAKLMVESDLAIGAAGSTSWERCCLGLPTVLVVAAENQWTGARALERAGAAVLLGGVSDIDTRLGWALAQAENSMASLAHASSGLCPGNGVRLVGGEMGLLHVH
jgi:UDP-2,4-diacetamido-2,4,6-trideoxy-beta-L-altropyranose hydrolase